MSYGFGPFDMPDYMRKWLGLPDPRDPIVLDLTGSGLQLTSYEFACVF